MNWFMFAFMAAIFMAAYHIIRQKALSKEHVMEYLTIYSIFCFILLLPFVSQVDFSQPILMWILIFFKSLVACLGFVFISKAYKHMGVSLVAPLALLTPLFFLLISVFFLREDLKAIHFGGISLLLIGTYILEIDHSQAGPGFKNKLQHLLSPFQVFRGKYYHYILLATFFFSLTITFDKIILVPDVIGLDIQAVDSMTMLFLFRMFAVLIFFTILSFSYDGYKGVIHGVKNAWGWIALAALVFNISDYFYFNAMTLAFAALVVSVKRLSAFFTTLVGGEIFHEKNLLHKSVASLVMIGGVVLLSI
ncbi:MAG: EamA family transporter [Nanoarchaeota archaeon]|nr:EamA family transporter [Nanoarchaeota archaeon]